MAYTLPTTGTDPKTTTKQSLEALIDSAIAAVSSAAINGFIYATGTTNGLARTSDGEGFFTATDLQLIFWLNDGGGAIQLSEIGTPLTQSQVEELQANYATITGLASQVSEDAAQTALDRVATAAIAETAAAAAATLGATAYATKAAMDIVTGAMDARAYVYADTTDANNGLYFWDGSSWAKDALDVQERLAAQERQFSVASTRARGGTAAPLPSNPVTYRRMTMDNGERIMFAAYGVVEPLDLIVIVGQSNAQGRGDSSLSPTVVEGIEIDGSTIIRPMSDPVGGALTGSMWPAWANEWFARTGRMIAFVETAMGGTSLIPDASGSNWSPSGSLRAAAVSAASAAIAAINADDGYELGNLYFIWAQGENEARNINGTTITGALYKPALKALADYFEAQVPEFTSMGVVRAGRLSPLGEETAWAEIRRAQDEACAEASNLIMLYRGTSGFAYDGRRLMSDEVHYDQSGLNVAGRLSAKVLAANTPPDVPAAPALLASEAFMDTDATTNLTGRTDSHTTATGTKMLLVAVMGSVVATNPTRSINGCTFNGVAMTKAFAPFSGYAAGDSTFSARADVALFYISETAYGAPLGGVTADIAVTTSAFNLLSVVALNLDAEALQEGGPIFYSGGGQGNTPTDTYSLTPSLGAPCFVVAMQNSIAASAAPLTSLLSGASFTEIADTGGSNGAGRSGQMMVATADVEEGVYDVDCTLSADAAVGLFYVLGFRGKLDGE